ncbi:PREDICTED: phytanoyl-CoA dioxygenase domain-containing protein 1 homolog [Polistes dominula]|uniref:Phytanoyl-CoA dioxygenase domain-containing protein 1 homolog n=1 Tax=Polistes dominula TaxID=743375 RepID=A0ABM1JGA8_POLDO|nr:PREDICTED: phytanoyl-CoA dioxygenase domain-containing protein 1 homolog [Polistes dominula]
MKDIVTEFNTNGFVVLEDLFKPEEVDEMKSCGEKFTEALPNEAEREIFSTSDEHRDLKKKSWDQYFLDSANKVCPFFEIDALEKDGTLKVDPKVSLNKVGHALHWLHPTFKKYTFDERIKEVAFQLGYIEPAVCQSMYIYKNPGNNSEVILHQDATYLYTDPVKLLGFWIALEDATQENGCLYIAPGSHKGGVNVRFLRNKDPDSEQLLIHDKPYPSYPLDTFRPVPVTKGTCVLIHGQVVHGSFPNRSKKTRNAYTFHIIETKDVTYAKDNWLQPPANGFALLYRN